MGSDPNLTETHANFSLIHRTLDQAPSSLDNSSSPASLLPIFLQQLCSTAPRRVLKVMLLC